MNETLNKTLGNTTSIGAINNIRDLMKPVGPGQYDLPQLTGQKQTISRIKNLPAYSISTRTDKMKKLIISKDHKVDQIGRDSPGVGAYNYDYSKL